VTLHHDGLAHGHDDGSVGRQQKLALLVASTRQAAFRTSGVKLSLPPIGAADP
jgi:hypothetical protein